MRYLSLFLIYLRYKCYKVNCYSIHRTAWLKYRLQRSYDELVFHKSNRKNISDIVSSTNASLSLETNTSSEDESSDESINISLAVSHSTDGELHHSALHLKSEIEATIQNFKLPWPATSDELNNESSVKSIPAVLFNFMSVMLGKSDDLPANRSRISWHSDLSLNRKILSICQDICSLYSGGKYITPKAVALGMATRHMTGSKHMSNLLSGLGHSISYDSTVRAETALALKQLDELESIPAGFRKGEPTTLVFDNIDFAEETLTGSGTTHHTNGIMFQCQDLSSANSSNSPVTFQHARSQRTFQPRALDIAPYFLSKKHGPMNLEKTCESPAESQDIFEEYSNLVDHSYLAIKSHGPHSLTECQLPGWTAFNISLSKPLCLSKIHYLPVIEASPTEMSTVKHVLNSAMEWTNKLEVDSIFVVFDQAIYSKAQQIRWSDTQMESRLVIRLGEFHTAMSFLGILGKRYRMSGLEDILVEAGVVAQGSMNGVLSGHMYNRSLRAHKLMFEALARLQLEDFIDNCAQPNEASVSIEKLYDDYVNSKVLNSSAALYFFKAFNEYKRERCSSSATYSFWNSYIELVMTLLAFVRATRLSDWNLHLASLRMMLPWYCAYDRVHYAR